jgi:TetR/AcrR family transcriptional regulator
MVLSIQPISDGNVRKKNKALIFNAAKTEFVTFGFKGASIKRIAERAELPRANIHYYFKDKEDLYKQLLADVLQIWNASFGQFTENDDPKTSLANYIRAKVLFSQQDPEASRLFASEIIHGAPFLQTYLANEFALWVEQKVRVINAWQAQGKMNKVNAHHLLFLIWSATQHYADFSVQVKSALNKTALSDDDFNEITESLTQMILSGVGLS